MKPVPTPDHTGRYELAAMPEDHQARMRMPVRIYRYRMIGMALAGLPFSAILHENNAPPVLWLLCALTCLGWPHLACFIAVRSASPYDAERRNLMIDSALGGLWIPLMQFNLLPSLLLATQVTVDKISTGIPNLWLWSLPGMLAGIVLGGLMTGFAFQPETSMPVMLATLPLLMIHAIAVSLGSYHLIRKFQQQKRQLVALSRFDTLTGLAQRGYWQQLASQALERHQRDGTPASLMMVDVDSFKHCNDTHGHACGDDILRAVATALEDQVAMQGRAGRFGGDEFAVLLSAASAREAVAIAERIRTAVAAIRLDEVPQLRCTVSIGIAQASPEHADLSAWMAEADAALYRAKRDGRDRVIHAAAGTDDQSAPAA